jgi:hypothetical protein
MVRSSVTAACLTDERHHGYPFGRRISCCGQVRCPVDPGNGVVTPSFEGTDGGLNMRIGTGVFLLAVGAILVFAVDYDVSGIELSTIGWILMAAGALAIVLFLTVWGPRDRTVDRGGVVEERRVYDDRPPAP